MPTKETLSINQTPQTVQRLSPRQVQIVRLLEMTAPELEEEVRRQLDDNPALEVVESEDTAKDDSDAYVDDNLDPDDDPEDRMPRRGMEGAEDARLWQIAADGPGLMETLQEQLDQMEADEVTRQAAMQIIGNIDHNGYLTRTLTSIADDLTFQSGREYSLAEMRKAHALVRQMDPAGVGAVDLRDCLLLQIDRMPLTPVSRTAREIVADYFDLFSKKHYDRLSVNLGISDERLRRGIDYILQLNPKPGSVIGGSASAARLSQITPDVVVEEDDNGRFTVYSTNTVPQLQVERSFATDLPLSVPQNKGMREAQAFIKLKRDDAEAFISALRHREATLVSVTEAIVRRQADFFRTGDTALLKPMILKDIATDTGYDLSVISRATAGKYVATSRATYPLKMFFNEAPSDNSDTSTHQLMDMIRKAIESENPRHPLSDQAILELLESKGHSLARRTVTKYREKLGYPVGRLRRKL